jgi:superfamily II DNA/RNA helicase
VDARVERQEQIVMGTAGTMLDWVLKKKVIDAKKIKMFVLDEADVMIDQQGQQDQTIRIQRQLSKECQMVLFSATYNEEVMKFASMVIPDPVIMRLKRNEESLDNIKQKPSLKLCAISMESFPSGRRWSSAILRRVQVGWQGRCTKRGTP